MNLHSTNSNERVIFTPLNSAEIAPEGGINTIIEAAQRKLIESPGNQALLIQLQSRLVGVKGSSMTGVLPIIQDLSRIKDPSTTFASRLNVIFGSEAVNDGEIKQKA